ncbi:hypothetical protein CDD83_4158 [Cordyceps sp. RAO-2017]|nr:hypothetical protein CDD83_4158 [Cordyceps sp. RAO-2017]
MDPNWQGQLAALRDTTAFPAFHQLPDESIIDFDFYGSTDGYAYTPRIHWCFLAEIVDITFFTRLRIIVKDVSGRLVPIFFHTHDGGMGLATSGLRVGYTVAILYAHQTTLPLNPTCEYIHQQVAETVKVFPVPLSELLHASDAVQRYAVECDGVRTCHGCDQEHASKICSKCKMM